MFYVADVQVVKRSFGVQAYRRILLLLPFLLSFFFLSTYYVPPTTESRICLYTYAYVRFLFYIPNIIYVKAKERSKRKKIKEEKKRAKKTKE